MKKLTVILMFTTLFGYAQIDYKGLIKNLEDVTIDTDLKIYFKDLPVEGEDEDFEFNDERFLRFYQIIIDKVEFTNGWRGKEMTIKFFNEKEDYDKIQAKLIELYGEPEIEERSATMTYEWETDKAQIYLEIVTENGIFKNFDSFKITFKKQNN